MNALNLIDNELRRLRLEISTHLDTIQDHETQIHELKMHNVELLADVTELEKTALLLKGMNTNVK